MGSVRARDVAIEVGLTIFGIILLLTRRPTAECATVPLSAEVSDVPTNSSFVPRPKPPQTVVRVGEEVLYHADDRWIPAEVVAVHSNGELALCYVTETECVRQRSTHGNQLYGWLTYDEAAQGAAKSTA